jgi:hypothetical protein
MNFDRDVPPIRDADWRRAIQAENEYRRREDRKAELRITLIMWGGAAFALAALAVAMLWGR